MSQWGGARTGSGRKAVLTEAERTERRKASAKRYRDNRRIRAEAPPAAPAIAPHIQPKPAGSDIDAILQVIRESAAQGRQRRNDSRFNPFQLPAFPERAMPPKQHRMAMDETSTSWAAAQWDTLSAQLGIGMEGLMFLGYAALTEMSQRPEYRIMSETIATECTRKWIKFSSARGTKKNRDAAEGEGPEGRKQPKLAGDRAPDDEVIRATPKEAGGNMAPEDDGEEDKSGKIKELEDFLDSLMVRDRYRELIQQDGFMGRAHLFHDFSKDAAGVYGDAAELKTPIGNGRDQISLSKVQRGTPMRLQTVEAIWTYPMGYNTNNPLAPDFYSPQFWYVMSREIHCTRLLTFVGHPVPDILKPSYAFGGLAMSQMAKPYVDIWLQTRESVAAMIHSFSVMCLGTDLATMLAPGGAGALLTRAGLFNTLRDNQGLFVYNKTTEDMKNVSAPLGGLHELQAQSQEHMFAVSRIPAVKFAGIQPAGLNASSEGEIRVFYDTIGAYQNAMVRPPLTRTIDFAQLCLWGKIDPDIVFDFQELWELNEKERMEAQKHQMEVDTGYTGGGIIDPEEVRDRLAADPDSPYQGIDPSDVPEPPVDPNAGEEGGDAEGGAGGFGGGESDPPAPKPKKGGGSAEDSVVPFAGARDSWHEEDHPRGQPGNAGQFGTGGGGKSKGEGNGEPKEQRAPKPSGSFKAPQFGLRGPARHGPHFTADPNPKAPESTVVFSEGYSVPQALNGVPFKSWAPPEDWASVDGQIEIDEPEFVVPEGKTPSSGVLIREPDGRVWILAPKGGYGGYDTTFPKGGVEKGLSNQANAIKEAWEETGLKVKITGYAGDHEGDATMTRYYLAERTGGDPADADEHESESVILAPIEKVRAMLNRPRDRKIAANLAGDCAWGALDDWQESKHPRDPDGKFTDGGGGSAHSAKHEYDIVAMAGKFLGNLGSAVASAFKGGKSPTFHDPIPGESTFKATSGTPILMTGMKKISEKKGSNPGGVYEAPNGNKFYVKTPKSKNHVSNELTAAALYKLAGAPTLNYVPVKGNEHVATQWTNLDKSNVSQLSPAEKKQAQEQFAIHAWLANWDAAGTGGDNQGVVNGKPTTLDVGGALEYRAQGEPKGELFGNNVVEWNTMTDPAAAPDAAALFGGMTKEQKIASIEKVTSLSDAEIAATVAANGGTKQLADKLIARKDSLAKIAAQIDPAWEAEHPRGPDGRYIKKAGGEPPKEMSLSLVPPEMAGTGAEEYATIKSSHITIGKTPEETHKLTVSKVLKSATPAGSNYRRLLQKLIQNAPKYDGDIAGNVVGALKQKMVESLGKTHANLVAEGKTGEADKVLKKMKEFGYTELGSPGAPAKPAPAPKPTPAPAPAPAAPKPAPAPAPKLPPPTEAELTKAKKTVALQSQYVPGYEQVISTAGQKAMNEAIAEFNGKYANKEMTSQPALIQKVNDFKLLSAKVAALGKIDAAQKDKIAAEQKAAAQKAAAEAQAKLAAEKKSAAEKNKGYMQALGISETEAMGFNALVEMHGGPAADLVAKFKSYESDAAKLGYPISGFQYALIRDYINGGYVSINKALRGKALTPAQHVYTKMVNSALAKMPKFTGTVTRGTTLSEADIAHYQPGHIIEEKAFTSTGVGFKFGGNVSYTIKAIGKRGGDFSKGANKGEKEVLFMAKTNFLVHSVTKKGGTTYIEMEEIDSYG